MLNIKKLNVNPNNEDSVIDTYINLKLAGFKISWSQYLKEIKKELK